MNKLKHGADIYKLCKKLWPITRSITGNGIRETLGIIQQEIPDPIIHEVPAGTPLIFDVIVNPHKG